MNPSTSSNVWRHFHKIDGKKVCMLCQQSYAAGTSTTTLIGHLDIKHRIAVQKRSAPVSQPQLQQQPHAQQALRDGDIRGMFAKQRKLTRVQEAEMDDAVVDFICMDMRPFASVDGDGFKRMVDKISQGSYKPKSRNTYHSMAVKAYDKAKGDLKGLLSGVKDICITTDMWTSNKNEAYISITAHWVDGNLKLQQAVLTTAEMSERHTGANLKERILKIVREYGIEKALVATVADNGSNIVNALNSLPVPRLSCFAHTLQLSIKLGLKVPAVKNVRGAAKHLVTRFKKSAIAATHLRTVQREEGEKAYALIMEIETRWNSTYSMMERLITVEWPVRRVLSNQDVVPRGDAQHLEMTDDSWELMKRLMPLLKPLFVITKMLQDQNYPTIALIYPSLYIIFKKFDPKEDDTGTLHHFKEEIKKKLDSSYYKPGYHTSFPVLAAAIDPRFKHLSFLSANLRRETYKELKDQIVAWKLDRMSPSTADPGTVSSPAPSTSDSATLVTSPDCAGPSHTSGAARDAFDMFECLTRAPDDTDAAGNYESIVADVELQFNNFLSRPTVTSTADPLEWWRREVKHFPALEIAVRRLFCIPSTSAPVERVFSSAGNIVNKKRSSLLPENVDMLVFMYKNKHLYA